MTLMILIIAVIKYIPGLSFTRKPSWKIHSPKLCKVHNKNWIIIITIINYTNKKSPIYDQSTSEVPKVVCFPKEAIIMLTCIINAIVSVRTRVCFRATVVSTYSLKDAHRMQKSLRRLAPPRPSSAECAASLFFFLPCPGGRTEHSVVFIRLYVVCVLKVPMAPIFVSVIAVAFCLFHVFHLTQVCR